MNFHPFFSLHCCLMSAQIISLSVVAFSWCLIVFYRLSVEEGGRIQSRFQMLLNLRAKPLTFPVSLELCLRTASKKTPQRLQFCFSPLPMNKTCKVYTLYRSRFMSSLQRTNGVNLIFCFFTDILDIHRKSFNSFTTCNGTK